LLTRPVGRPSYKPVVRYKSFLYQAASLEVGTAGGGEGGVPLRGVVPVGRVYRDQLPDFKLGVVRFYNKRGTAEQWIKEGKQAAAMTRLSCHRFR
jgi:hypothetical protein